MLPEEWDQFDYTYWICKLHFCVLWYWTKVKDHCGDLAQGEIPVVHNLA